tara:strand:- start:91 stop:426 length:336 start_codon:yes stop_codon:yes gene_type:complete
MPDFKIIFLCISFLSIKNRQTTKMLRGNTVKIKHLEQQLDTIIAENNNLRMVFCNNENINENLYSTLCNSKKRQLTENNYESIDDDFDDNLDDDFGDRDDGGRYEYNPYYF